MFLRLWVRHFSSPCTKIDEIQYLLVIRYIHSLLSVFAIKKDLTNHTPLNSELLLYGVMEFAKLLANCHSSQEEY